MSDKFIVATKRIIAVDSASFAYIEAPIDDSLLLLATGNYGKSSLINAIRFFFLPELNLNFCANKFAFKNGKTAPEPEYYSKDQVADYYFPSEQSCLILEVEHKFLGGGARRHCQLISLGNKYKLNRYFIPVPFDDIEHLFWDKSVGCAGASSAHIPGANLLKALKEIDKGTVQVRSDEELQKTLYHAECLRPELSPFVIYPLSEIKPSTVNSLRALIKLLFNKDSDSLRIMTSTSIDIQESSAGALEVDIDELIKQQKQLKEEQEAIEQLKASQPEFAKLRANFDKQKSLQNHEQAYAQTIVDTRCTTQALAEKYNALVEAEPPLKQQKDQVLKNRNEAERALRDLARDQKRAQSELNKSQKHIDDCQKVLAEYFGQPTHEVVEQLTEHLTAREQELELLTDKMKRAVRLQELPNLINTAKQQVATLKARIQKVEFSLAEQLPEHERTVLKAINENLLNANPSRVLTPAELQTITDFAGLFVQQGSQLMLFDESFQIIKDGYIISLDEKLSIAESQLSQLNHEQADLTAVDKNSAIIGQAKNSEIERDIQLTKRDLGLLSEFEYHQKHKNKLSAEIASITTNISSAQLATEKAGRSAEHADKAYSEHLTRRTVAQNQLSTATELVNLINADLISYPRVNHIVEQLSPSSSLSSAVEATTLPSLNDLVAYRQKLEQGKEARAAVTSELMQFIYKGIISDEHGLLTGNHQGSDLVATFNKLASKYETLEHSQEQLENDRKVHNKYVRNRLDRLDKTKTHIDKTIERINNDLETAKVNDLEGVKLSVVINGAFEDLVLNWREFDDLNSEGMLPDDWYTRLKTFLASDAVDQLDGKLRMENLISQASYLTKKANEPWDNKGQSTSTQMLINMHFSEIFVKKLANDNCAVHFPMMMDEVGQVSVEQFNPLIAGLKKLGHSFIGATTHGKAGQLVESFTHYLILDRMTTATPFDAKRNKVCFAPKPEFLINKHQQALLEM